MTTLKFADTHNMVAFLSKPAESDGFEQIVDFLNAQPIRYALTVNPIIYISCIEQFWSTGVVKTINGEVQLHALVDGKKIIIFEASVRRDLKLEDEEGIDCLPNSTIFEQLALMGLEAEQDSDNITKTRSKATPNDLVPLGTTSGGGPRCQETIGILLLKLGGSGSLKRKEVQELMGRKDKKMKTYPGLMFKIGEEMFDVDALDGEEVFVTGQNENVVEEVVDATQVSTAATTVTITTKEITLAQAHTTLKTSKPKVKGIAFQEPSTTTTTTTTTISSQQL
ncbi:hypothetical protein Tco_1316575 [Tanacetum coccineum]